MSVLAQRAIAGRALHDSMRRPDLRHWLDTNATFARDEDGDVVSMTFASDEPSSVLVDETVPYGHPVVMSTLHRQTLAVWVLGPISVNDEDVSHDEVTTQVETIRVHASMSVGDVVDRLTDLARRAYGVPFVLEFAGSRRRVATLAPA